MKGKLLISFILISLFANGQDVIQEIQSDITQEEIETHIRFLASDELLGRETGTREINIAAAYISAYFEALGVKKLPGMDSYYQAIPFYQTSTATKGIITIDGNEYSIESSLATDYINSVELDGSLVFVNYGSADELSSKNIGDKIVLLMAGEEGGDFRQALSPSLLQSKLSSLKEAGAKAVIVLWHYKELPWGRLRSYLIQQGLSVEKPSEDEFPYFFLDATNDKELATLKAINEKPASISYSGREVSVVESYNVVGYVQGEDETAKEEYLLLSAHYDHVGGEFTDNGEDKIYNGARDNAVGTAAIMMAADYFTENKPKRSVIFAAWTAEEKGLLGSRYFVENSPVPLEKIIYNLNIDNAGYNDTTKVTVVGLNRTMASEAMKTAASAFEVEAITDPAPEQNLFDRSDNVNFAKKGIPSPTFSLGFTAFDQEIGKYYHQVADEAESLNFNYVTKYTRAYILAAQKIADMETDTFWMEGDKYEEAGKALYKK